MRRAATAAAVLLALVTALGLLGPATGAADVVAATRPHMAALALCLAALTVLGSRHLSLLFGLLAAANILAVTSYPSAPIAAPAGGERLRIMTLNTLYTVDNLDAIEALIARHDPDLVLLQEQVVAKHRLHARLADRYPHQAFCRRRGECEAAILSRHRFVRAEALKVGRDGASLALVQLGPEHGDLTVASVHLRWPLLSDQDDQLAAALRHIGRGPGPIVLAGDFNALPWSPVLTGLAARTGLRTAGGYRATWPARHHRTGRTCPWCVPHLQLDHVLVSPELRVLATRTGADIGSDHLPLIADIELPRAPRERLSE